MGSWNSLEILKLYGTFFFFFKDPLPLQLVSSVLQGKHGNSPYFSTGFPCSILCYMVVLCSGEELGTINLIFNMEVLRWLLVQVGKIVHSCIAQSIVLLSVKIYRIINSERTPGLESSTLVCRKTNGNLYVSFNLSIQIHNYNVLMLVWE